MLWLPPQASTTAQYVDPLFYFILYTSSFFFLLVIAVMCLYVWKYRRKEDGEKTSSIKGNHTIEIVWSIIPTILLVIMFYWGFKNWMELNVPPGNALDIRVTAQRWLWTYDYPKDGITSPELVVPVNTPVKLTMSATDVIHSFFVPQFRIKKDVIPNRYTVVWFEATEPGEYPVMCTEYCGTGHSRMLSKVKAVSYAEYTQWIQSGGGAEKPKEGVSLTEYGKSLFTKQACNTCHSVEGQKLVGPPLNGKYGSQDELEGGKKVLVDDNYIRESLMEPTAKVVKGFPPVMPTYKGKLDDSQINALIDYLKSLK